ncbi:EI24 domain-containing protein [Ottowia testudinis]|uniref:EI24 domain-containing protein n=1 Tax=Ottowia testudinis TaxID=2816950 RepID=A0A975CIY9_9BURK|nr:EI24 domain-containing protein [Ottowia testudinis]
MKPVFDAFARALAQAFLPRVIGLTLLPLAAMTALALLLGWLWWGAAVAWMQAALQGWPVLGWLGARLSVQAPGGLAGWLAPLFVVMLAMPVIVLATLAVVSLWLTPVLTRLVAERRFPRLQRLQGASLASSIGWSAGSLAVAVAALAVTLPLWLIPPLVLIVPPLIWGWLTYRVMSFDALADHASADERRAILKAHRWPLLAIGVLCGYMGAAPGVVWASGLLFAALFVVLVPLAIWIYTFVFVLSSLWFAHYCLDALARLRGDAGGPPPDAAALPPAGASITKVS